MPQGNLETFVSTCAGGSRDNKVVFETLATTEIDHDDDDHHFHSSEEKPPESFWLSKDAEFDWFDRNAFYERKDSHKGSSVPNSGNLISNHIPNPNTNSQRLSLKKSKASLIGLPIKPQKSCFLEPKNRKNTKPGNTRLFPKRFGSVKSDRQFVEPSSPNVSCMGRVRSKRDRNGRLKKSSCKPTGVEQVVKEKTTRKRGGLFSSFRAIFRSNGKASEGHALRVASSSLSPGNKDIRSRLPPDDRDAISIEREITESEPIAVPVGLGGMKRFASGRKSELLI